MDLEMYKELSDLNENIYNLKMKNVRFEEQRKLFDQIGSVEEELGKLNFVNDFIVLISENLKKMSALTLTLMNQTEERNSMNCMFKLRKELKSVLIEYLQRLISFTLEDDKESGNKRQDKIELDSKFSSDEIAPVYDFIINKIETNLIKDVNEKKVLNEIASDFHKIIDQLEKFDKVFN